MFHVHFVRVPGSLNAHDVHQVSLLRSITCSDRKRGARLQTTPRAASTSIYCIRVYPIVLARASASPRVREAFPALDLSSTVFISHGRDCRAMSVVAVAGSVVPES